MSVEYKVEIRNTELRDFLVNLLTDDDGISEKAFDHMCLVIDRMFPDGKNGPGFISEILRNVEATDGRFYLPEGWEDVERFQ